MNSILTINDVKKSFDGIDALNGASFDVEKGKITGLIGPNGAGKTTLFNTITGFISPESGSIKFEGEELIGKPPYEITRKGLARTFQITRSLDKMTVMDNLLLAPREQTGESVIWPIITPGKVEEEEIEVREMAMDILEFFNLDEHKDEYAGSLSGGQKKLLELARVLMIEPKMVLLDEAFAGVNPSLSNKLVDYIKHLRDDHEISFLLIEHDIPLIMEVCEDIIVMAKGEVIARGKPKEIKNNQKVLDAYLGVVHDE
ncbi:ABC transporter ATP-binding protein [archaeon SCG-AAA382B04]|nr:ABC transporter ATP-binding protein [archaeon SCG-AAA382B04]